MEGRGGPRIVFVGGGSYQWGPKIIQDVALNDPLVGSGPFAREMFEAQREYLPQF